MYYIDTLLIGKSKRVQEKDILFFLLMLSPGCIFVFATQFVSHIMHNVLIVGVCVTYSLASIAPPILSMKGRVWELQ